MSIIYKNTLILLVGRILPKSSLMYYMLINMKLCYYTYYVLFRSWHRIDNNQNCHLLDIWFGVAIFHSVTVNKVSKSII